MHELHKSISVVIHHLQPRKYAEPFVLHRFVHQHLLHNQPKYEPYQYHDVSWQDAEPYHHFPWLPVGRNKLIDFPHFRFSTAIKICKKKNGNLENITNR